MVTDYGYDSRDRMDTITHKTSAAGSKVEEYTYTMDDAGLIDRIDHLDDCNAVKSSTRSDCSVTQSPRDHGSYWDYTYDTRYRLTDATRNNKATSPAIKVETWESHPLFINV